MPKGPKRFWSSVTRAVFPKLKLEDATNPTRYLGHTVMARPELDAPDEKITIADIQGCAAVANNEKGYDSKLIKYYQINGTHFCHMLSFHTQMDEGRVPTDEEMAEFELATEIKDIVRTDGKKKEK